MQRGGGFVLRLFTCRVIQINPYIEVQEKTAQGLIALPVQHLKLTETHLQTHQLPDQVLTPHGLVRRPSAWERKTLRRGGGPDPALGKELDK